MKTNIISGLQWLGIWIIICVLAVFTIFVWIFEKIFRIKHKPNQNKGWANQKCFD